MRQPQRRTKNRSRKKLHNQQWSIQPWRKRREATLQIHSRNTSWATQNITGQGPLDMALQMQKSFNSKDTVGGQNPIASFHLTDHARIWFIQFEHNKGTPSWSQFSSAFQKHFGPPCGDNSLWKMEIIRIATTRANGGVHRPIHGTASKNQQSQSNTANNVVYGRSGTIRIVAH